MGDFLEQLFIEQLLDCMLGYVKLLVNSVRVDSRRNANKRTIHT